MTQPAPDYRWKLLPAAELARHRDAWDELLGKTCRHAFLSSGFLLQALKDFAQGDELLAVASTADGWLAAAIVKPRGWGRWASFQPSQLPLGPVLATPGTDITHLAQSLRRALPGPALALGLTQLDEDLFPPPAPSEGLKVLPYIQTAWVDVDRPFDTYWEERGKNLRQNTRKQRRKVEASGSLPRLECLQAEADVAGAVAEFGVLEASGWKAEAGTAIDEQNVQGQFYRGALAEAARGGQLRIYRYRFGDEVVAMDLCVTQRDSIVILKTAYHTAHQAVSPSTLMREEQFKALFEEGRFKRIEFFGRIMEWHTRWTENARGLYHLTTYRWTWLPKLLAALNRSAA
jgi:CelD/BcsL family acetyltransferase involved in cellulose biosynthesis